MYICFYFHKVSYDLFDWILLKEIIVPAVKASEAETRGRKKIRVLSK